jgi:hypothetical protein
MNSRFFYAVRLTCSIATIALAVAGGSAFAQVTQKPGAPTVTPEQQQVVTPEQQKVLSEVKANAEKPGGANDQAILDKYFGAGIMANFDTKWGHGEKRVKSARVVNGVVRVEQEATAQVGFMLEAHKFTSDPPDGKRRHVRGPFLGLVMSGEGAIDTAILGYMWGWRQPSSTQTLNVGVGASISPAAQVLGDGITADQPLPPGETEVRYKKVTKYGIAVTVSFGF